MSQRRRTLAALLLAGTAFPLPALAQEPAEALEEVVVIGIAPRGLGVPASRIPANVQSVGSEAISQPGTGTLSQALDRRLGSVAAVDSLGNPLQQGLSIRGFTAAPALGEPQGVAVYQGVMRVNEAFGDVVQWDLLPTFAIEEAQVIPGSSPVYGPNTIGGAVVLNMKNGFTSPGGRVELGIGRFDRYSATAEYGGSSGPLGFYAGANHEEDGGWRDETESELQRGFADLAWRGQDGSELGVSLNAARSRLAGNGPAPTDLLEQRRKAVFTYPDNTNTDLFAASVRGSTELSPSLSLTGGGYYRYLKRKTINGDQAEFEECEEFVGLIPGFTPPEESYCFGAEVEEEDGELEVEGTPTVLVGPDGVAVEELDTDPDAVFNRTRTRTHSWGLSGQAAWTAKLGGMENILVAGATLDHARTRYGSGSELGTLLPDRGTESLGVTIGNDEFNVGLKTESWLTGLYVSDTLSLTPTLHLTGALRWNRSDIKMRDQIGTDLDGDHLFSRVNPALGLAWNAHPAATLYASWAESNRAPTPAELSCADPEKPCRFPNAFLADPPLDDVVARTFEVGVRGRTKLGEDASLSYALAAYTTRNKDDIIFISAGPIVGTGYFDNAGNTRRQGIEANLTGQVGPIGFYASYGYVKATFRTPLTIAAPDNPAANEDGDIAVERGDRIPGIPAHTVKAGADVAVTDAFTVGAELVAASGRYLRGDEANLQPKTDGFTVLNASASYRLGKVELFARLENVFDTDYETFGIFGEADELGFEDPRFLSPGAPRTWFVGARARF